MTHPAEQSIGGLEPAAALRATVQGRALPVGAERLVFYGLLICSLIPVLAFEHLPIEDGPMHVANAAVYLYSEEAVFAEYYDFDLTPIPNLLADLVLAVMVTVMPPALALKLFGLFLAAGFPLAVRWCLKALNPHMVWLGTLSIPLAQGRLFYFGLLNFLLGVVLAFFSVGIWLHYIRGRERHNLRWVALALMFAFVYLSHPLPFLALSLIIWASIVSDALRASEQGEAFWRGLSRRLIPFLAVSAVPLGMLILVAGGEASSVQYSSSFVERIIYFPVHVVTGLTVYETPFAALSSFSIALVAVMSVWKGRAPVRSSPGFLIAVGVMVVIYFLGPDTIAYGGAVRMRVLMVATAVGLLWLGCRTVPYWVRFAALAATAVVILGLMGLRLPLLSQWNEDSAEYLSGSVVLEPGSTVLPLWVSDAGVRGPDGGRPLVLPLIELAGSLTSSGLVVDLHHLPASLGAFPFRFAPGYDIRQTAGEGAGFEFQFGPEMVDIEQYEEQGGARVDYVWLWGRSEADPALSDSERAQRVLALLETDFDLVFTSEEGHLEVYARR